MEHEHDGKNNSHVNIEDEVVQHTKGKKESTKFEHQCLESNRWSQYSFVDVHRKRMFNIL